MVRSESENPAPHPASGRIGACCVNYVNALTGFSASVLTQSVRMLDPSPENQLTPSATIPPMGVRAAHVASLIANTRAICLADPSSNRLTQPISEAPDSINPSSFLQLMPTTKRDARHQVELTRSVSIS